MLIDAVIYAMYAAVSVALMAVVASVALALRRAKGKSGVVNGIHERRLAVATAAATVVLLAVTFALGSAEPLSAGGATFTDRLWLKAADMFLLTVAVLIAVLIIAALCLPAAVKLAGKRRKRKAGDDH